MNETSIMLGLAGLGLAACVIRIVRRRRKDYRKHIEPELQKMGLKVRAIRTAPLLDVGQFPKFEIKVVNGWSETPVGGGEFTEYRIVDAVDPEGRPKTAWCKLEFEIFQFRSIELKVESKKCV